MRDRFRYSFLRTSVVFVALSVYITLLAADLIKPGRRWWAHVQYLADDKLEGRKTGSEGHRKAAAYVAEGFKRAGLKPAGTDGFFHPIKFRSRQIREEASGLHLVRNGVAEALHLGEDAFFSLRTDLDERIEAPAVFVGYGLTIPEKNYDDLAGLDLRGKIALFLSGGPASIPGPLRAHYQTPIERWKFLRKAGAIGMARLENPRSMDMPWSRVTLARKQAFLSLVDEALEETPGLRFSIIINSDRADKFFAGTGHTFSEILTLADQEKPLPKLARNEPAKGNVAFVSSEVESQNVVGLLMGSDPKLKQEYVVLSAHLDHLGVGEPINGDSIYNGAMDDASGVGSLLTIAESFKDAKKIPRRSLIFLAVTGEESGLLGSKYFAAYPTVKSENIVANLNMDCYLPLFPLRVLTSQGLEESDLGDRLRAVAAAMGIRVQADPEPDRNRFIRSDQYSFIRNGVPALAFKFSYEKGSPEEEIYRSWWRERYHSPSDDAHQPVDLAAAAKFNQLILALAERIANEPERPRWHSDSFFRRFVKTKE